LFSFPKTLKPKDLSLSPILSDLLSILSQELLASRIKIGDRIKPLILLSYSSRNLGMILSRTFHKLFEDIHPVMVSSESVSYLLARAYTYYTFLTKDLASELLTRLPVVNLLG
jgi:hypothetical protein